MYKLLPFWKELIQSIINTSFNIFKIIIPITIIVKVIEELGGVHYISLILEPVMQFVGLPSSMGLVWATTILTNIYGGMIVFIGIAAQESLSVEQVTVLSCMMLIAHSLPIEIRIIQKAGVRVIYIFLLRILTALLMGYIVHKVCTFGEFLNTPNSAIWNPTVSENADLFSWVLDQLIAFVQIFIIISALMTFLKILKVSGIEKLLATAMQPLLRIIGLGKNTTSISIIGVLLGITYGGGLLIHEARKGDISKKELFGSLTLLALLHSVIEDTILLLLMGAHLSGILFFRLFIALLITRIMIHWVSTLSNASFERYFVYAKQP